MSRYLSVLLAGLFLSACGGGSSGGSGGGGNSSSAGTGGPGPISSGCGTESTIFENCLNKEWGEFRVWENNRQTGTGQGYSTETNASNVQWKLVDSPAAGHGKVVEVSYGQTTNLESQLYVANEKTADRSAYATGKVVFDLNVLDFGDAYDPNTGTMQFEVIVECVWPCLSHSAKVPVTTLNQWQTVELSIADMVRDGLDLKKIDSTFLIRPSIEDGAQTGVQFQVDNIKWVKGSGSLPATNDVYAEHFDTTAAADKWVFAQYGGGISQIHKHLSQGLGTFPEWQSGADHWALETRLDKAINLRNKTASFQIKFSSAVVAGDRGSIDFTLVATDGSGRTLESPSFASGTLDNKQWHQISLQLGSSFPDGFNGADVRKLGIHFYAAGNPYAYGLIYLDTIRISE